MPVEIADPLWAEALQMAQSSMGDMLDLHVQYGSEMHVKYPLTTASGQIEHVWGRLIAVDSSTVRVSLETPTVNRLAIEPPYSVQIAELEDWQLVLPSGEIRGGYTTQAQIVLAKREGRFIPPQIQGMEGRFSDHLRSAA